MAHFRSSPVTTTSLLECRDSSKVCPSNADVQKRGERGDLVTIMCARARGGDDAHPSSPPLSTLRLPGPDPGLMAGREGGGWDARGGGDGGGYWRGGDRFDSGGGGGGGGPPQGPGGGGGRSREGGDGEGQCTRDLFDLVSKYIYMKR